MPVYEKALDDLRFPYGILTEKITNDYKIKGYPFVVVVNEEGEAVNKGVANNVDSLNNIIVTQKTLQEA